MAPGAGTPCVPTQAQGGPTLPNTREIAACRSLPKGKLIPAGHGSAMLCFSHHGCQLWHWGAWLETGLRGLPAAWFWFAHVGFGTEDLRKGIKYLWLLKRQFCRAFSLLGLQPPPEWVAQLGERLLALFGSRAAGLPGKGEDGEAFPRAEATLACPANRHGLLGVCSENGANPNPGQG